MLNAHCMSRLGRTIRPAFTLTLECNTELIIPTYLAPAQIRASVKGQVACLQLNQKGSSFKEGPISILCVLGGGGNLVSQPMGKTQTERVSERSAEVNFGTKREEALRRWRKLHNGEMLGQVFSTRGLLADVFCAARVYFVEYHRTPCDYRVNSTGHIHFYVNSK